MNETSKAIVWEREPTKPTDLLFIFIPVALAIIMTGIEFLYVLATLN